ncbi:MAG: hypothetical protein E5W00_14375 [Mesorhizobium sp.]|nr:MAG: hypothetical protein E5W00_14375 [Mesorhizobium sp.]
MTEDLGPWAAAAASDDEQRILTCTIGGTLPWLFICAELSHVHAARPLIRNAVEEVDLRPAASFRVGVTRA